ncbi:hypothetical protein FRC07_006564 [Ceratobasidium sp. 392]|nr:hypothetical protein FRC07_006564 [Ceratobasidium sp. 392]
MPANRQHSSRSGTRNNAPYARLSTPPQDTPEPMDTLIHPLDAHDLDSDRSPLPTNARQLTRLHAMFWSSRSMLNDGFELRKAIEEGNDYTLRATATKTKKLNYRLSEELDKLQPDLFPMLATSGNHFLRNVRKKLTEGCSGAKAEDNCKVKNALAHVWKWDPPLKDLPKASRGLNHPGCAELLAPITVNMEDEEERRQFVECNNPPMLAKHWPGCIYKGGRGNAKEPSKGLLQGELMVATAKIIVKSPSSVLPSTSVRPGAPKRGRKGVATKYHMTKVTPAFLAYVAVILRFALSSEETFNEDGGTFDYTEFYSQLCEYLESPKFRTKTDTLIDWWNRALFPDSLHIDEDTGDSGGAHTGMLALLEAEAEEEAIGDESD